IEENERNLWKFEQAAGKAGAIRTITYNRKEYSSLLSGELDSIISGGEGLNVIFDTSTCSSYVFYPTISELLSRNINLKIVYTEASEYYPTLEEWQGVAKKAEEENSFFAEAFENAGFQSVGVDAVYSPSLFSEMNSGNRPTS